MSLLALIDADIFAFKAACAGEQEFNFGERVVKQVSMENAVANLERQIKAVLDHLKTERFLACLSSPTRHYFRHDIEPTYKGNRTGEPPALLGAMKQHIRDVYPIAEKPNLEADDVMGIIQTMRDDTVICSIDKDMLQIPGLILNTDRIDEGVIAVTEEEGDRWHLMQTLMGDTTDGYPGRKGTGIKKAGPIVDIGWEAIVEDFEKIGQDEEFALKQARLAKILRAEDWDKEKQEVILWTPKS